MDPEWEAAQGDSSLGASSSVKQHSNTMLQLGIANFTSQASPPHKEKKHF